MHCKVLLVEYSWYMYVCITSIVLAKHMDSTVVSRHILLYRNNILLYRNNIFL